MFPQFKSLWGKEKQDLEKIGAEILIPLKAKGELVGVFALGPKRSEELYSQDDQLTLITLANQTAVTIDNARLHWELQNTLEELKDAHDDLEIRVEERTAELENSNRALLSEIAVRKNAEEKIKTALDEKEVLIKEIHHRVKNNLQIISSLLSLQAGKINDRESLEIYRETEDRVRSMALIHAKLYESEDLASINFLDYLDSLTESLFNSYVHGGRIPELTVKSEEINIDIDLAIPLGLIITELLSNSLKHAFTEDNTGKITIEIVADPTECCTHFIVGDNGAGIPKSVNFQNASSLGLRLVKSLVNQIGANISIDRKTGTTFTISVPDI